MYDDEQEDTRQYTVVVNHEEQYSVWFVGRELPLGWTEVGKVGPKQECLDYIERIWTDMRPLSLRKQMDEDARRGHDARVGSTTAVSPSGASGVGI